MDISYRIIGDSIFEITVKTSDSKIQTDVCHLDGLISESIIEQMEDVVSEMKEWNLRNTSKKLL